MGQIQTRLTLSLNVWWKSPHPSHLPDVRYNGISVLMTEDTMKFNLRLLFDAECYAGSDDITQRRGKYLLRNDHSMDKHSKCPARRMGVMRTAKEVEAREITESKGFEILLRHYANKASEVVSNIAHKLTKKDSKDKSDEASIEEKVQYLIKNPQLWNEFRQYLVDSNAITSYAVQELLNVFVEENLKGYRVQQKPVRRASTGSFAKVTTSTRTFLKKRRASLCSIGSSVRNCPVSSEDDGLNAPKNNVMVMDSCAADVSLAIAPKESNNFPNKTLTTHIDGIHSRPCSFEAIMHQYKLEKDDAPSYVFQKMQRHLSRQA